MPVYLIPLSSILTQTENVYDSLIGPAFTNFFILKMQLSRNKSKNYRHKNLLFKCLMQFKRKISKT